MCMVLLSPRTSTNLTSHHFKIKPLDIGKSRHFVLKKWRKRIVLFNSNSPCNFTFFILPISAPIHGRLCVQFQICFPLRSAFKAYNKHRFFCSVRVTYVFRARGTGHETVNQRSHSVTINGLFTCDCKLITRNLRCSSDPQICFQDYVKTRNGNMSSTRSFLICVYVNLIQKANLPLQN
jgi:hypothetical protein